MKSGTIYTGIGGWTYEPWRGVFYPKGLPHAQELRYAAEHLTSTEVNGTFYSTQSPKTFRKWASEVPRDFVFALKGLSAPCSGSSRQPRNSTKPILAAS